MGGSNRKAETEKLVKVGKKFQIANNKRIHNFAGSHSDGGDARPSAGSPAEHGGLPREEHEVSHHRRSGQNTRHRVRARNAAGRKIYFFMSTILKNEVMIEMRCDLSLYSSSFLIF